MAHRVRYAMQFNAREAMHLIELRSAPHGHPAYRDVVQRMADRIEHDAGHPVVAGMLRYLDRSEAELGRLESERKSEGRRTTE
jgi:thymidylate synthase ThyX